jgi:hypothetical protein
MKNTTLTLMTVLTLALSTSAFAKPNPRSSITCQKDGVEVAALFDGDEPADVIEVSGLTSPRPYQIDVNTGGLSYKASKDPHGTDATLYRIDGYDSAGARVVMNVSFSGDEDSGEILIWLPGQPAKKLTLSGDYFCKVR